MSNFSSKTKYVEARPRREKKLGRGGSVVSGATSGGGGGVSKSYVDSNFVTLATEQTISGAKDFVGGIKVNGMPITYNVELGVWEFTGDLLVTGAVTMFGSLSGFKPSTIMDAVQVDNETIIKVKDAQGNWVLRAPGGGSGGTGGGLTAAEVILLIENALKPYALSTSIPTDNKQLSNGAGYATVSDLDTRINNLINGAPAAYDTLKEIADVLAGNVNSIGDILTALDTKATKTYVDTELTKYVKLATAQPIEAQHNFVNGLQIGSLPITKSASSANTIYLDANLVVSGAITMFGSGSTTFPTIWANIPFNLEHMSWDGSQWNVIVEGGSGSGSLDTNAVNVLISEYLTRNNYATISDISSALVGYATQSWVGDNYLSKSGGTITGASGALTVARSDADQIGILFTGASGNLGLIGFSASDTPAYINYDGNAYPIIHSGNIGQQSVNRATSAGTTDSVSVTPVTESGNYSLALLPSSSTGTQAVCVGNNHKALFNPSTGALTATSFVGNLTGNADSADVLKKSFANEDINYSAGDGLKLIYCHGNPGSYATAYQSGISVLTDYAGWQLTCYGGVNIPNPYFRQRDDAGIWRDWHQLAFLTDNVASATKLQTPRTIWGHSFDGTANIESGAKPRFTYALFCAENDTEVGYIGRASGLNTDVYLTALAGSALRLGSNGIDDRLILDLNGNVVVGGTTAGSCKMRISSPRIDYFTWQSGYLANNSDFGIDLNGVFGIYTSINYASGDVALQVGRSDGIEESYNLLLQPLGGNVAIGGTTADAKLHVYGNSRYEGYLYTKDSFVNTLARDYSGSWARGVEWIGIGDTINASIQAYCNNSIIEYINITANGEFSNLGIRIYNSGLITLGGDTTIYGNLLTTGVITMFSQASMKNVIDYDGLSLEQLVQIRPTRFTWKDSRDSLVHAGGIADEVMQVLPEVVHRTKDDKLTMDYGSAGFFIATSLIKPVVDHERRIAELERENKHLKQQLEQLSA